MLHARAQFVALAGNSPTRPERHRHQGGGRPAGVQGEASAPLHDEVAQAPVSHPRLWSPPEAGPLSACLTATMSLNAEAVYPLATQSLLGGHIACCLPERTVVIGEARVTGAYIPLRA